MLGSLRATSGATEIGTAALEHADPDGEDLRQPNASVFTGPISCQDGTVLVAAGQTMTYDQVNNIHCLVKGVLSTLTKS